MRSRGQRRVDGVGRPKFDFHTGSREHVFNFRASVRPVAMEAHIQGFTGKHYCPRMATMNKPTYRSILQYSPTKPVLVFVSSRRQTCAPEFCPPPCFSSPSRRRALKRPLAHVPHALPDAASAPAPLFFPHTDTHLTQRLRLIAGGSRLSTSSLTARRTRRSSSRCC